MNEHNHIDEKALTAFRLNQLSAKETEALLEHICSCDFCSGLFADSMKEDLVRAPRDLKDKLMRTIERPEVQLAKHAREVSKRMQLFLYSLKVGTAMAGALLLLFLTISLSSRQTVPKTDIDQEKPGFTVTLNAAIRNNMDSLNNGLIKFSNKIMNTEVNNNEEKEK
jgi:anti-sigma factor RsiW